ncbi:MAG: hypothetical protein ACI92I_000515 [Acidimicrobiales bacterium]|jgi:hypothetical protein
MKYIKYIILLSLPLIAVWLVISSLDAPMQPEATVDPSDYSFEIPVMPDVESKIIPTTVGVGLSETIPFDTIFKEEPTDSFKKVLDSIYLDSYIILSCPQSGEGENTVMLTAKYTQDPEGNNFEAAQSTLENWETYIYEDIGHLIFPSLVNSNRVDRLIFEDVLDSNYRKATFRAGAETKSIYSGWRLNYVFYSSSQECLVEAMDMVYEGD